ncbi:ATP-dependent RecD-like DNA helicase [[Clostridium] aminophilum]|uniref:SF1B family DNA helicase RecD2 n=1 Tax=[Clostridium] aminophilum TaxID=1526 RepID=UPI003331E89D
MAQVKGYIEKIKFRNEENGYTVMSVSGADDGEEYILVGTFSYLSEGEMIDAEGSMTVHPVYGEQLQVEHYEILAPEDTVSMEKYLASGAIKGIGAALARRIVKKFRKDTFRIMEEEPERLAEIKGISERMAMEISDQVEEKKEMRQAMMFLQGYGISMNLAVKIYREYGPMVYTVLQKNPYKLADDISGVGFRMADEIAAKAGIAVDSDFRICSGILYTLVQASVNGNTCLPETELRAQAAEILGVEADLIDKHLMDMQIDKRIVVKLRPDGERMVYASRFYYMENGIAGMLHDLNISGNEPEDEIRKNLAIIQERDGIALDELQIQAVVQAVNRGLLVITGGPGTGKTTTINAIISYFEQGDMKILLAAPTGRAAKRMTEATGREAKTIHRLLEISGIPDEEDRTNQALEGRSSMHFEKDEDNPLEADAVIIDEMSMVDVALMHSLLKAVSVGTRLILVGDVDQLPSVGPGNVLRDIIGSACVPVVRLTHIFRQAAKSDIIVNAHKINEGQPVDLGKRSEDFLFLKRADANAIINCMITLVRDKLPGYVKSGVYDVQIMTPMRKGALGVERLNRIFQQYLNPASPDKREKEMGDVLYREGDKVMQIKNNYQIEWKRRGRGGVILDEGTGIFNGDMGIIREINLPAELITVEFDEGHLVEYAFGDLDQLEHAYAITIHKSQGSEYPAVVVPVLSGPRVLMTRNLIYTAVTRARSCVCIVGLPDAFASMAENAMEQKRYSGLKDRIMEICL